MSSTNLEVVFEGPAVKSGMIDARLLAESLAGYSEVFTRSNSIANGSDVSEAAVLVRSEFKGGFHRRSEQTTIEKSEAEYFESGPSLDLESDSSPMEGQREAVLIVSKLAFVEGTTASAPFQVR